MSQASRAARTETAKNHLEDQRCSSASSTPTRLENQVSVVGKPIQSILLPTYSNRIPPSKHPGIRIPLCPTTCDWAMAPHNLPKPIEPHWTLPNWNPFGWWIPNTKCFPNTKIYHGGWKFHHTLMDRSATSAPLADANHRCRVWVKIGCCKMVCVRVYVCIYVYVII